jgi:ribosomal protein S27AE
MSEITDKLTHAYIRNIKRWMFCPACGGKMRVNRNTSVWKCGNCDYSLSVKEFENNYIFWLCDGCDTFLNNQPAFDLGVKRWVCVKCSHDNDISAGNIFDNCKLHGAYP